MFNRDTGTSNGYMVGKQTAIAIALFVTLTVALPAEDRWPGVKVTYYKGAKFEEKLMTTYGRELRFDGWVPLPCEKKGVGPFSIRWEADLKVDKAGEYAFRFGRTAWMAFDMQVHGKPVEWNGRRLMRNTIKGERTGSAECRSPSRSLCWQASCRSGWNSATGMAGSIVVAATNCSGGVRSTKKPHRLPARICLPGRAS